MNLKLAIILIFFSAISAKAQNLTIELSYKYNAGEPYFSRDSFYFQLNKTLFPSLTGETPNHKVKSIQFFKSGENRKTVCTYKLSDASLAIIADGFGHEIILIPNDTIKIASIKEDISNKKPLPWTRSFTFSGPNRYIHSLFDSLAYCTGDVKMDMVNPNGKTIDEYLKVVDDRYADRLKYLDKYCKKYGIPPSISNLVRSEIYSAYVKDITFLQSFQLMSKSSNDLRYLLTPRIDFNKLKTKNFLKTVSALQSIYEYLLYLKTPFKVTDFYDKTRFMNVYDLIKENYNSNLRDDLLTWHMGRFISAGYSSYIDAHMSTYKIDCKDEKSISYIDSLFKVKKALSKLTYKDVISMVVKDLDDKPLVLKDSFNHKPTLIDCWASWCKPCLGEFPFSKQLEEEFKGKINFIYLSFDKSSTAWKAKAKELNIVSNTYHIPDNFDSGFAGYFKINTIPRYILIDSNGDLVSNDAPRPSDPKLKEMFDSLLNSGAY